jgi:hypothetical protein
LVSLQELGADEVLNYKEEDFAEKYKDKPFDLVIDPIGGEPIMKSCGQVCFSLPHCCCCFMHACWPQPSVVRLVHVMGSHDASLPSGVVEDKSYTVLGQHGTYTHILNKCVTQFVFPSLKILLAI